MVRFHHEKRTFYQSSIRFVLRATEPLARVQKSLAVHNQLDRASTSIPPNIAEGNGKFTSADRWRFFDNARGPALECAACLDVMVAKGIVETTADESGKEILVQIVAMLVGLIRANSETRKV